MTLFVLASQILEPQDLDAIVTDVDGVPKLMTVYTGTSHFRHGAGATLTPEPVLSFVPQLDRRIRLFAELRNVQPVVVASLASVTEDADVAAINSAIVELIVNDFVLDNVTVRRSYLVIRAETAAQNGAVEAFSYQVTTLMNLKEGLHGLSTADPQRGGVDFNYYALGGNATPPLPSGTVIG